jgi:hypothetical protein
LRHGDAAGEVTNEEIQRDSPYARDRAPHSDSKRLGSRPPSGVRLANPRVFTVVTTIDDTCAASTIEWRGRGAWVDLVIWVPHTW